MKTIKTILLIGLLLVLNKHVQAQIFIVDSYYFTIDDIDEKTIDELIEAVKNSINEYDKYAKLLDEDTRTVTQRALNRFKNLFEFNAQIYDDLSEEPTEMNYADYAGKVLENLEEEGVDFSIYGALIDQISYDSAGYYYVDVVTEKYLYNGLEEDNSPFYCRKGRIFRMRFTFIIPEENLKNARINKIKGSLAKDCEDRVPVFILDGAFQKGFDNRDFSDFYSQNLSTLDWSRSGIYSLSLGASFQYPLDKKDEFFFLSGLYYSFWQLNFSLNGIYSFRTVDEEGIPLDKVVQISNAVEKNRLGYINVPIGLKYKWLDKDPIYGFLDASFVFNIPIYSNGDFNSEAVYSGRYDDGTEEFFNFENGILIPDKFRLSSTLDPKIFYSLRISPTIQYALGQNIALNLGLDYFHSLTQWIDSNPANIPILGNGESDYNRNLIESYTTRFSVNSLGFRIGFIYKKRWL